MEQIQIVEGDPVQVGERTLVPVVRVTRRVERRALVSTDRLGGQGRAVVHLEPLAIVEQGADGERTIPLRRWTERHAGLVLLLAFTSGALVAWLVARRR